VFERHFEAVHTYLQRRVGADLADDLTSDTFVQAFRARSKYDLSHYDARPWLLGIATNLVRHHRRAEHRRFAAYERLVSRAVQSEYREGDEPAGSTGAEQGMIRTLRSLPLRDREVVFLYAWADLSYAEIARALSIPIGTVRSRLSRARERMEPNRSDRAIER